MSKRQIQINNSKQAFYNIQKILQPKATIEIGASMAEFSRAMIESLGHNNIYALEANTNIFNNFVNEHYEIYKNKMKYENIVCSDHSGEETFLYQGDDKNNTHETNSILWKFLNFIGDKTPKKTKSTSLDDYVTKHNIPKQRALWIDVEGAVRHVLLGGIKTLKQTQSIHVEVETEEIWEGQWTEGYVKQFLESMGFRLVAYQQHSDQKDVIYIKEDLVSESVIHCIREFVVT